MNSQIHPLFWFVYMQEKPDFDHPWIQEVPAGDYLCFRGKILADEYDPTYIKKFFERDEGVHFVIANEYEDNFIEFRNSTFEIQILI